MDELGAEAGRDCACVQQTLHALHRACARHASVEEMCRARRGYCPVHVAEVQHGDGRWLRGPMCRSAVDHAPDLPCLCRARAASLLQNCGLQSQPAMFLDGWSWAVIGGRLRALFPWSGRSQWMVSFWLLRLSLGDQHALDACIVEGDPEPPSGWVRPVCPQDAVVVPSSCFC